MPDPRVSIQAIAPIPYKDMPRLTANCDIGMIAYQRDLGIDSMPNRLFEYMAAGLAVLAPSYSVELREVLIKEGIGITVDFESPESIACGIDWMISNPEEVRAMGRRAREAFMARHSWEVEFEKLIEAMRVQV